jgi:hypothetical protein
LPLAGDLGGLRQPLTAEKQRLKNARIIAAEIAFLGNRARWLLPMQKSRPVAVGGLSLRQ